MLNTFPPPTILKREGAEAYYIHLCGCKVKPASILELVLKFGMEVWTTGKIPYSKNKSLIKTSVLYICKISLTKLYNEKSWYSYEIYSTKILAINFSFLGLLRQKEYNHTLPHYSCLSSTVKRKLNFSKT